MKLSPQQYAQALFEALEGTEPRDHDKVMDNFVAILKQNGDLEKYGEIERAFERLDKESRGIKQAEVTVAREVEINKGIIEDLNQIVGSKVEVSKKIDEGIIGGVIVKVDDTLIDASVKGQLTSLENRLKS
jgi:F-type H+-transporting ATPase subunit delta